MPDERHLVLVGLPGAGKSTVGRLLAARLGWPFLDFDDEIAREAGMTVAAIFAAEGEAGFRVRERTLTEQLRAAPPSVLAPGGGWITQPETVALIRPRCRLVWLVVSPSEATRRLGADAATRPLLSGDAESRLQELLRARERYYATAETRLDTELVSLQLLVEQLAQLASPQDVAIG